MGRAGEGLGNGAEPPIRIDSREELVYLLGEACELEHGLLCEYLYAQFSLKRGVDEGISQPELDRILAWETTLIDIIMKPSNASPGSTMTTRKRSTGSRCQGKNQLPIAPT